MNSLYLKTIKEDFKGSFAQKKILDKIGKSNFPIHLSKVEQPYSAFLISELKNYTRGASIVVMPTEQEAIQFKNDLDLYDQDVYHLPHWGTMIYKGISAQASLFGERMGALIALLESKKDTIIITSLKAITHYLPDPETIKKSLHKIKLGQDFDAKKLESDMAVFGYNRVPRVSLPGEFAMRGEVLDFFPPGEELACRIVFEFDTVEEIRFFDPISQGSTRKAESVIIRPVKELIWDEEKLAVLDDNLQKLELEREIVETLLTQGEYRGEELYYSLAFNSKYTIMDYIDPKSVIYWSDYDRIETLEDARIKEYSEIYARAKNEGYDYPQPDEITDTLDNLLVKSQRHIFFRSLRKEGEEELDKIPLNSQPGRSFFGNMEYFKKELSNLDEAGHKIFIFAAAESQADRIRYILKDCNVEVVPENISSGYALPDSLITVIQENEIFGRRKRQPQSIKKAKSEVIDSFIDLNPGDYVVHVNYGIGLFKGVKRMKAAGNERDYIEIEYGGEETIFIPIEQVNLIQRYIGQDHDRGPKLDKIGGASWEKKKSKVKKKVEDIADRLIKLYAKRQEAQGFSFPPDNDFQVEFEASFPYQETQDQLAAVADIKRDMESNRPMDRLVCGDVGYGKTEVAMRAIFKCVMGGKQAALLAPTTILAEQHYENMCERFKRFPIKIGMLSRLVSKAEQKMVLKGLIEGDIDILIGTHRILSKDVVYKNIGLLAVDEEQRFGVKHKERLKEIKHNIDSLTLSATPIPRTLHMSLVKIRDMSLLKTAPSNRQPIETFVQEFDPDLVAKAIRREVDRGGQVFYLHNRVESLERTRIFLQELVPEVMVEEAHGQMSPRELEDIMHRFIHGGFQVLVSTTIVENGIDIPNVNTIIMDSANMFGISQLYQLRGRVGRSGRLAYAYLLYPENRALTELAMKRLKIISDFTDLGSGFKIAMKDMEVRGAGNLLGAEQSGDILAVGFDMYLKLLEAAVEERKESKTAEESAPEVYLELEYSGFIPNSYITGATEKMEVYKRIAAVTEDSELEQLTAELYDRFGPAPDEMQSLLSLAEIRIICKKLWIKSLRERKGIATVEFGKVSRISVDKLMKLIRDSNGAVKLNPAKPDAMLLETGSVGLKEKSEFLRERLFTLL